MHTVVINCSEPDWQNVAEANLRQGTEIDLTNFNYSFDAEICKNLAVSNSMDFRFDPNTGTALLRKRKT